MEKYLDEFIEVKAKLEAIKAYVSASDRSYLSSRVIKLILGLEVTDDDD